MNTKQKALIKSGVGIANRDKGLALEGINEFIHLSIMELEMDRWEAESDQYDNEYDEELNP